MEFDICTDANPEQTIEIFERTIPTGVEFGTVTVRINESFFEVTTLRSESNYSDGRRPKIVNWGTRPLRGFVKTGFHNELHGL